jgi:YD repeat-containing protein
MFYYKKHIFAVKQTQNFKYNINSLTISKHEQSNYKQTYDSQKRITNATLSKRRF